MPLKGLSKLDIISKSGGRQILIDIQEIKVLMTMEEMDGRCLKDQFDGIGETAACEGAVQDGTLTQGCSW